MRCEHDREKSNCAECKPEQVFRQYQRKAKQRGLSFTLTLDQFISILAKPCFYCGETYEIRGLDRVDNRLSYYVENLVAACSECNFMKRVMTKDRFIRRAVKIAK